MRLPDFIAANRVPILAEWDSFARSCTPASGAMDYIALRDHAGEMLTAIVADLRTRESEQARSEKSKGNAPADAAEPLTAAESHGSGRAASGFTMAQMIAEYRALRASVLRLWTQAHGDAAAPGDLDDLTRFNEAIDQALAESVSQFSEELDQSKEIFLAILGHDLRTPLGAIFTSARFMLDSHELAEPHLTLASGIARSSTRMAHMVADLLDFTRGRLGGGIPIVRAEVRMEQLVRAVVAEMAAAQPCRVIEFEGGDDGAGQWDSARISQALTNLLSNALEHGAGETVVRVTLRGDAEAVEVTLHNFGPPISAARLSGLFDPMKASTMAGGERASGPLAGLGLGLYIAERIVHAHQGRIDVTSEDVRGTTFTVHLPRHAEATLG